MMAKNTQQDGPEFLRVPPHSAEAEQAVLGSILIVGSEDQGVREIFDTLLPEMFYNATHQFIYESTLEMRGQKIDLITVSEHIEKKNNHEFGDAGGFAYMAELAKNTPSAANALAYANIVRQRSILREYIGIANTTAEMAFHGSNEEEIDDYLNRQLSGMEKGSNYEPQHIGNLVEGYIERLDARNKNERADIGIKTGISAIDDQIGGVMPDWLVVIAGRPSMGKTIQSQIINAKIARKENTLFFSMEMSKEQIMDRFVSVLSGVHEDHLRDGDLTDKECARINSALGKMANGQSMIYYDETPGLSINQIKVRSKNTKKKLGHLGAIFIDYLGLMKMPQVAKSDRHDIAVGEVTRSLKELAKELQTPIFLLVQANRDTDRKSRPSMSNLKDSSSIEADADLILFVHRDEVNNEKSVLKGVTEIIPVKFRHGSCNQTAYVKREGDDVVGYKFRCLGAAEVERLMNMAEQRKDYV